MLVNKDVVADESARLGPRVDVGSSLLAELDAQVGRAFAMGCWSAFVGPSTVSIELHLSVPEISDSSISLTG